MSLVFKAVDMGRREKWVRCSTDSMNRWEENG